MEREIDHRVTWTGENIAPGVAKRKRRGIGERGGVEEMIRVALAGRQVNGLAGHDIGTVGRAGVREVSRNVDGVHRRSILECQISAELPITEDWFPQGRGWD